MIYFIQEGKDGPIKIGYTSKTGKSRLANLQIGNYRELHVIKEINGSDKEAHEIYDQFKHIHIKGEWFASTEDLMCFITGLLSVEYNDLLKAEFCHHIENLRELPPTTKPSKLDARIQVQFAERN